MKHSMTYSGDRAKKNLALTDNGATEIEIKVQAAIKSVIDANSQLDQALALLQQSADQAILRAKSAAEIASSAFCSISSSKKAVDNLNSTLSQSTLEINLNVLRQAARKSAMLAGLAAAQIADRKAFSSTAVVKTVGKKRLDPAEESRRLALEIADKAKSSFLANMSHEIRTPLAAIVGFAEIVSREVLDKGSDSPELSSHVDAILRNSKHLLALINDVLDISKIDSGALEVETNSVSIRDELDHIVQMLSVKAQQHNDAITIECNDDVPSMITTDPTKLRQILINLLSNAIKFTEHGSISIHVHRIETENANAEGTLKIQIIVSGIGIAPSNQKKLFSSYGQADRSTSRRFGGTGLGLVLAKKLARALGGDVNLTKSALGFGSTFEFELPLVIADNSKISHADHLLPFSSDDGSIKGCRVLLAEDSSDMQNLVGHIIKSKGGEIHFAKNGRDAIEKATESQYDMILMDVEMPILDGNEANKQLRKKGLKVPIIAFTAHAFINKEHFNDAVYDDYITKPITSNQLIKTINRWYQSNHMH